MKSLQFLITAFVVCIASGTGVIYTLALGLRAAIFGALAARLAFEPA